MKSKKIMIIIPSLCGGGAERVVINLVNYLDKNQYNILLAIFEDNEDYRKKLRKTIEIVCLNKNTRWDFFKLILGLRKVMFGFNPDVVISFLHYANIITVLAGLLLKRKSKLFVSERSSLREYLPQTCFKYLRKWLMMITYRKADLILLNSKISQIALVEDFFIKPEKIITIHNPIDVDTIKTNSMEKIRHHFFDENDTFVIVGVGRLTRAKRFDRLLRAFSMVTAKEKMARLIILGKGELSEKLKELSKELGLNEFVDFVGFQSNPYAWISKAKIFVLSSDYEGFPNVILEAMACGTPVISTDCSSGPKEIITNGTNGILVQPEDENALAEAILVLLKDESLQKKFSEEGKKRAENFKIENILPKYEELF